MADNSQKTALTTSLNSFAKRKYLNQLQLEGKALPATVVSVLGWIVVVNVAVTSKFTIPQLMVPVASSEYDYLPLQVGDTGLLVPADAYLGGISGLGGGTARFGLVPNLSALLFVPNGNSSFPVPADPNSRLIQGPNGVVIQDIGKKSVITLTPDGITIVLQNGDAVAITGDLTVTGDITAGFGGGDSVTLQNHTHSGGSVGSGTTTAPDAGT
jgi:hypothetical protein